jgi:hypothetical protein
MRLVLQNGEDGCGIACVAMLANTTYRKARDKLPDYWEPVGTTKKQLRYGLQRYYGIKTSKPKPIRGKDYRKFKFDAVLHGCLGDERHWTVWDSKRKKLLDPYWPKQQFKCTSFVRIRASN